MQSVGVCGLANDAPLMLIDFWGRTLRFIAQANIKKRTKSRAERGCGTERRSGLT